MTTHTDRELLEYAAKAANLNVVWDEVYQCFQMAYKPGYSFEEWNPLTDDGDALRLAVKMRLTVQVRDDHVKVGWSGCVQWMGEDCLPCDFEYMPTATRRAIVRAAAQIGGIAT